MIKNKRLNNESMLMSLSDIASYFDESFVKKWLF